MKPDSIPEFLKQRVVEAAIRWWASKRPDGITLQNHLEHPCVGLKDDEAGFPPCEEEEVLCRRVADYYLLQCADESGVVPPDEGIAGVINP